MGRKRRRGVAKFWFAVLTDLKTRGVKDIFFGVCDGLKVLPDSVSAVFPAATVQTCIIHLIRGTFRYASRKYWDQMSRAGTPRPFMILTQPRGLAGRHTRLLAGRAGVGGLGKDSRSGSRGTRRGTKF